MNYIYKGDELYHHGIKGMHWGDWNEETRARYNGLRLFRGGAGTGMISKIKEKYEGKKFSRDLKKLNRKNADKIMAKYDNDKLKQMNDRLQIQNELKKKLKEQDDLDHPAKAAFRDAMKVANQEALKDITRKAYNEAGKTAVEYLLGPSTKDAASKLGDTMKSVNNLKDELKRNGMNKSDVDAAATQMIDKFKKDNSIAGRLSSDLKAMADKARDSGGESSKPSKNDKKNSEQQPKSEPKENPIVKNATEAFSSYQKQANDYVKQQQQSTANKASEVKTKANFINADSAPSKPKSTWINADAPTGSDGLKVGFGSSSSSGDGLKVGLGSRNASVSSTASSAASREGMSQASKILGMNIDYDKTDW